MGLCRLKRFSGKIVLASVIAIGGIAAGPLSGLPVLTREASAAMHSFQNWLKIINSKTLAHGTSFSTSHSIDHKERTTLWYIKNEHGTIKIKGSNSVKYSTTTNDGLTTWNTAELKTDVSSLKPGKYSLLYIYNVGNTTYRSSQYFIIKPDGSLAYYY